MPKVIVRGLFSLDLGYRLLHIPRSILRMISAPMFLDSGGGSPALAHFCRLEKERKEVQIGFEWRVGLHRTRPHGL